MPEIFVGRQPIYNRNLGIYAYELLFRADGTRNSVEYPFEEDKATSKVIINAFLEIGLDRLVGNGHACINLTERFILDEQSLPFEPPKVILEVLESVEPTPAVISAVRRLSEKGFRIALDDFIYHERLRPLVELADIIKIDIRSQNRTALQDHVALLKQFNIPLLAEKVETLEEYDACRELGFEYFQGYFLSRPRIIKSPSLPTNRLNVMSLLAVLHNDKTDIDEIEHIITQDVSISYKILKLINSAFFGFPKKVESIRHAIVLLGRKQLAAWASLLVLSGMDDRPTEMIHIALLRAKMCELLAEKARLKPLESYFTVGMFSALDILMERSLKTLVAPLPLAPEITHALLDKTGPQGEALRCVLAYEVSEWQQAKFQDLSPDELTDANTQAFIWADEILANLQ